MNLTIKRIIIIIIIMISRKLQSIYSCSNAKGDNSNMTYIVSHKSLRAALFQSNGEYVKGNYISELQLSIQIYPSYPLTIC